VHEVWCKMGKKPQVSSPGPNSCVEEVLDAMSIEDGDEEDQEPVASSHEEALYLSLAATEGIQGKKTIKLQGERASRPLVGYGVLIDNTIKGLICLREIMSRYLICEMI